MTRDHTQLDPKARGQAIRDARARRTRTIRRRVAGAAAALFSAAWLGITVVLVSGHDPALSKTTAAAVTTTTTAASPSTRTAASATTPTTTTNPATTTTSSAASSPSSSVTTRQS
jgi:hypothetical protein